MIKIIKINKLEENYNLDVMQNYLKFRFARHCPENYKEYRVYDKGVTVGYSLKNGNRLYYKD